MKIKDRIKSLRRVRAGDLLPSPKNWRLHPENQQNGMRAVLAKIGWADAVLVRETPDGLMLIDGHLRSELAPDEKIPCLVLDLNEQEADEVMATHDPLAALAEADLDKLRPLADSLTIDNQDLHAMLDDLTDRGSETTGQQTSSSQAVPELWQVVANCKGEEEQKELYDRLKKEGYDVKLLVI